MRLCSPTRFAQRSVPISLRLTHLFQVAGWQGPAMRRRASGGRRADHSFSYASPSWLARNEHFINEADNNRSMASSTKLIMAAGSLPVHGPMPSTAVSYVEHVYHPRLNPPATHSSTVHDHAKVLVSPAIDPASTIVPGVSPTAAPP